MPALVAIDAFGPDGCNGTWSAPWPPQLRIVVRGDEGSFEVEPHRYADGRWDAVFPATLARGTYLIRAELWRRVEHDAKALSVR